MADHITFPITADYVANWTVPKAMGEMVSNAFDEGGEVRCEWADGYLTIADDGAGLPRRGLIMGYSTKRESADTIGVFGEGSCMFLLVAAREGLDCVIETVGYSVRPRMAYDAKLGDTVLQLHFSDNDRVRGTEVRIKVKESVAKAVRARFLRFDPRWTPPTGTGTLLTTVGGGRIYVGGVLVKDKTENFFSYDFALSVELKKAMNRDRTFISDYTLGRMIEAVISEVRDPEILASLLRAAMEGKAEARELSFATHDPGMRRCLEEARAILFGDRLTAIADYDTTAMANAEYLGYTLVARDGKHTHGLRRIFAAAGLPQAGQVAKGTVSKKEKKRYQEARAVTWVAASALTAVETASLHGCITSLETIFGKGALGKVRVFRQANDTTLCQGGSWRGFYEASSRTIAVDRSLLLDLRQLRATLFHELGHRQAHIDTFYDYGDNSIGFERALVKLAAVAVERLHRGDVWPVVSATANETAERAARDPRRRLRTLLADRMRERQLSIAKLASAAYLRPTAVRRILLGQMPSLRAEAVALGDELGCDGEIVAGILASAVITQGTRRRSGGMYGSESTKQALLAVEALMQRPDTADVAAQIHEQATKGITHLSEDELAAPYGVLMDMLVPSAVSIAV